jgi:hypothetical protein
MRDVAFALLPVAKATLLRRKEAGTLLPGTCAPHEEAWELAYLTHGVKLCADDDPLRTMLPTLAQRVDYNTYLSGARLALLRVMTRTAGAELRADLAFVCDALDMLTQQRPLNAVRADAETNLVQTLQSSLDGGFLSDTDDIGGAQLLAAWGRVERSGVLQARNITQAVAVSTRNDERVTSMAATAVAAKGLRHCALGSCGARELHASHFKLCGACKTVVYCSREHQAAHWRQHKAACKAARSGGAGGSATSSDER